MPTIERLRIGLRFLPGFAAAVLAALSLTFLAGIAVFGLPGEGETAMAYADRACRLAKAALDRHLPCLEDIAGGSGRPADREALWSVVGTLCLPASYVGLSFPCTRLRRDKGYAVLRSPARNGSSFIITPLVPVPGVESVGDAPESVRKLWLSAWEERHLLEEAANRKLNWSDVVLAVNSKATRSQDQLHIHIGCIDGALRDFLAAEPPSAEKNWQVARPAAMNVGFFVRLLPAEAMKGDLFKMVFDEIPGARPQAERQTIAVAGVTRGSWRGFALIAPLQTVSAEEFLARDCRAR